MGRTEKSQGLAPPAIRKEVRAKQARHIINKIVPAILASNARARKGAEGSELIVDPKPGITGAKAGSNDGVRGGEDITYITRKGQGRRKVKTGQGFDEDTVARAGNGAGDDRRGKGKKRNDSLDDRVSDLKLTCAPPISPKKNRTVRIIATDTLTAAHMLTFPSRYDNIKTNSTKPNSKAQNVCILNMASPLRPGGGVLTGATSQEEFLCARSTLLPSLKEAFYRLPELGGVWTSDVLVFRSALPLGESKGELGAGERYWLDVISAGMLRFPELEGGEDEVKTLGKKDRDLVEAKMCAVLRIAAGRGIKKLVLGAWGCGAYGNPVADIAKAWRKVLDGGCSASRKGSRVTAVEVESWEAVEDVIFAITNRKMANDFAQAYGGGTEVEPGLGGVVDNVEDDEEDSVAEELRTKIREMESQLSKVWNQDLKARMGDIVDGLKAQLREREEGPRGSDELAGEQQDEEDETSGGVSNHQTGRASRGFIDGGDDNEVSKGEDYSEDEQSLNSLGGVRVDG